MTSMQKRRRADMTRRLNDLYDQNYKAEDLLQESLMQKGNSGKRADVCAIYDRNPLAF